MNRTVAWLAALAIAATGAGCVVEQAHPCAGFRTYAHREYAKRDVAARRVEGESAEKPSGAAATT